MKDLTFFSLVPLGLRQRSYVAGGAAVPNRTDPPRDIDIWVLTTDKNADRTLLFNWLENIGHGDYRVFPTSTYNIPNLCKLLQVRAFDMQIQIMLIEAADVEQMLAEFDLTVHAYAYDWEGNTFQSPNATLPGEPIRVQKWTTPHSTLRRYFTMCDRYRVRPVWSDVSNLAKCLLDVERVKAESRAKQLISDITGEEL
jgi:hypothetical protein